MTYTHVQINIYNQITKYYGKIENVLFHRHGYIYWMYSLIFFQILIK